MLAVVQKGILDAKIKKYADQEEMLENNTKRLFTILPGQHTESLLSKLGGGAAITSPLSTTKM